MKQKLLAAGFVLAGTLLGGCAVRGGYYSGYAAYGPPAPRYGVVGVAPGPGYIWTDGFWDWGGRDWRWSPGRWQRPPHAGAHWVAPEWRHEGRGWRRRGGYWR